MQLSEQSSELVRVAKEAGNFLILFTNAAKKLKTIRAC
jgi:hypothetical protein